MNTRRSNINFFRGNWLGSVTSGSIRENKTKSSYISHIHSEAPTRLIVTKFGFEAYFADIINFDKFHKNTFRGFWPFP